MAANRCEFSRNDGMLVIQFQGADKCLLQLRQEMKRAAQKRDMSPDGLSAGQAADGLIDHCLKNGGGKVFLCGAVVIRG